MQIETNVDSIQARQPGYHRVGPGCVGKVIADRVVATDGDVVGEQRGLPSAVVAFPGDPQGGQDVGRQLGSGKIPDVVVDGGNVVAAELGARVPAADADGQAVS